ncbi:tripartite tricarboxylate transporter substrate binding protein [Ramlibacter sp. 2FC]|uniref:Bug family tripartite tricarboxylate transporter substrate binding protein n=1 Tax=Ramlibacter sp. 2FC TaxID=2502188 RepID=UPI0010F82BED|nr:tripartite tricarboxylate transporter substrate binding protein [Ramlibacter sp. 2FC]
MNKALILSAALIAAVATGVHGQTFPDRPVKFILPFPTGTGPDTVMRLVGERLTRIWGQQVVVENKPGGNGWIAMDAAKRAPADGYTLLQVDASQMSAHPHLFKKMPIDPVKDFDPVAPMYRTHYYVTVAADSKWKTVGDLIAEAKAKPGAVTYGSSGMGGNIHLGGAMMEKATGTKMHHVPYKETTQIYMAIASGDIQWAVGTASTTQPLLKAGKLKYLAVTGPQRTSILPEIPTMAESQGPANYELQTWVGLYVPRGTPKAIVDRLNADVTRVIREPEIRARLAAVGFEGLAQTPEEFQKMMSADSMKFGTLIKEMNITLD